MKTMKYLFIPALLGFSIFANAQDTVIVEQPVTEEIIIDDSFPEDDGAVKRLKNGIVFYYGARGSLLDVEDLNGRLKGQNYPEFAKPSTLWGGGAMFVMKNFMLGGEWYKLISKNVNNFDYSATLTGNYSFFNIGYLVYSTRKINIFPQLGIGGGRLSLKISENLKEPFDSTLANPRTLGTDLRIKNTMLNGGIHMHFKAKRGFGWGLSAGYIYVPEYSDWLNNNNPITDGPEASPGGPYFTLMIGSSALNSKRN